MHLATIPAHSAKVYEWPAGHKKSSNDSQNSGLKALRLPDEAVARFADALHGRATGGESLAEVERRVMDGWRTLLQQHPGGRVLVVTHATPIQLVLCRVSGMPSALHWRWRVDLGSLTALDVYGGGAIVRMVNEVPRLTDD